MAPEILNGHPYNYKVDMYSLGVSIFETLIGAVPFIGENKQDLTRNVNTGLIRI
jgi:serine/threonine protein kinase